METFLSYVFLIALAIVFAWQAYWMFILDRQIQRREEEDSVEEV